MKGKKKPVWRKEGQRDIATRWLKTGKITIDDVERARQEGRREGARIALDYYLLMHLASTAIALHDLHGFAKSRLADIYSRSAEIQIEEITIQDTVDRCKRETGLDVAEFIKDYSPV